MTLFARLAIGGVLLYSGFMKAVAPAAEFAAALEAYKLFPAALLKPLSIGVPYTEMWIGLFVLTGYFLRKSALAAAALHGQALPRNGQMRQRAVPVVLECPRPVADQRLPDQR